MTAEGRILHDRAHKAGRESRKMKRIEYDLPLRSFRLGVSGRADVVEFHKIDSRWLPYPVEYKRGKPKKDDSDKVQLCAQALCLEEMLGLSIEKGALFYGKTHRRLEVDFDEKLRMKTTDAAARLHKLFETGLTPKPEYSKKCRSCSFESLCLPKTIIKKRKVSTYLEKMLA